jgi:hypothetical protein
MEPKIAIVKYKDSYLCSVEIGENPDPRTFYWGYEIANVVKFSVTEREAEHIDAIHPRHFVGEGFIVPKEAKMKLIKNGPTEP